MSEAIISSNGPAFGVLEVNAGFARKIGLKDGDLVRHPMFRGNGGERLSPSAAHASQTLGAFGV